MAVFTAIGATVATATGLAWLGTVTAAALQVAAGIAFTLIGKSMQGEPEASKFGVQGKLQAGEDVPRSINLGWNCTAGSLVWHGTFGAGGTMSARVIAIGDLPIRELLYPIVGGVDSTLLKDETHPDYGWPVAEYRKGGVDHLWVKFYDGTQTAADPFLVGTFGADPDRPYGPSRVGRGVPHAVVFARAPERNDEGDKPLFQGIPELKFVSNGVRWYNVALDSTAGGVGAHRWDNPATWGGEGDFNPIVQLYSVLRGIRFAGGWLYGMQGTTAARLPAASWIAGIMAAQTAIAGPEGLEPTYRAGGEVQVGAQVATTVEALLTAANARLVESGGAYKVFVGPPGAPVMAFTDGDILSTEEQSFSPFHSLADTVNAIHASYPNPAEGWGLKKFTLLRPDLEPQAGNRRLPAPVSFDLVPYHGQVQRLTNWAMGEGLRARRHTYVLGSEFRQVEAGDVLRWSSARNGYMDKLFRVDGLVYRANLDVVVDLTEVDPSDYDWNQGADYRPVIDGPLQLVGPTPMPMLGWQVFPANIVDEDGRGRRPSVEVRATGGLSGVERVRVQVRVGDETGPLIFDSDAQPYAAPYRWILQGQFTPATPVAVRGIMVGPPAADWSGWFVVTTPDTRLSIYDINDAMAKLTGVLSGPGSLNERFAAVERRLAQNAAAGITIGTTLRKDTDNAKAEFIEQISIVVDDLQALVDVTTLLRAEFDDNVAFVGSQLTALATADGALATAITEVAAEVGDVSAGGFFAMKVDIAPTGWDVSLAMIARATAGGIDYEAGLWIYLKSDGTTGIALKGNSLVLIDDTGGIVSSPFNVVGGIVYMTDVRISGSLMLDETVDTNVLTANAATGAISSAPTGDRGPGDNLGTIVVPVLFGSVDVELDGYQYVPSSGSGNFGDYRFTVYRDGSALSPTWDYHYDDNYSQPVRVKLTDHPGVGTFTYTCDFTILSGSGGVTLGKCQLAARNFKR